RPLPVTSPIRSINVSFTLLNVSAALSACSLIWSASCVNFSKSPFGSSDRSCPTSPSRSSATRSTSFSDAIRCSFRRLSQQGSKWPEVEVQVLVPKAEVLFRLVHPLGELHERLPEAVDLL